MAFINEMKENSIDIASEYLVMASELIEMKSKLLLPRQQEEKEALLELEKQAKKIVDNKKKIEKKAELNDHKKAFELLVSELISNNIVDSLDDISGIGHRIVQGGSYFDRSVIASEDVIQKIDELSSLAPLHNPAAVTGIKAAKAVVPNALQTGAFDTAFHQTMPKQNYIYPVPYEWYTKYGVRKYGFHGTSHKYITGEMKKRLDKENVNLIICHVGSGASIACVKDGKCYDTTMGLTPLDGLMMGTRSGAIDPSILEFVMQEANMNINEITNELNKKSGFLGVAGVADCRDVEKLASDNNENAILALDMYADRIAKYIADYYLELEGNVDAIVLTAGIGENSAYVRKGIVNRLSKILPVSLDEERNDAIAGFKDIHSGCITKEESVLPILVMPTNEELMMARDALDLIK